jgi:hypothetical protein
MSMFVEGGTYRTDIRAGVREGLPPRYHDLHQRRPGLTNQCQRQGSIAVVVLARIFTSPARTG